MNAHSAIDSTRASEPTRKSARLAKGKENPQENEARPSLARAAKAKRKSSNDPTRATKSIRKVDDDYQPIDDDDADDGKARPTRRKNNMSVAGRKTLSDTANAAMKAAVESGEIEKNGVIHNLFLRALEIGGAPAFQIEHLSYNGRYKHLVTPQVLALPLHDPRVQILLKEGKEPMVPISELDQDDPNATVRFERIRIPATDPTRPKSENNMEDFAIALKTPSESGRTKSSWLKKNTLPKAGFLAASSNPDPMGGGGAWKPVREEHRYYKKGCTIRGNAKFFGKYGTLRSYYEKTGKWNLEYIQSLDNDEKRYLLQALLYEEDVDNVQQLTF